MPDNAPDQTEGPDEVTLDFQAFNSEHGIMVPMLTFGGPTDRASVLVQAYPDGDVLRISVKTDVDDNRENAISSTLEFLEAMVEAIRNGGTEEAWAAQFATPYEPNSEQTTAPGSQFDLLDPEEREI